MVLSMMERTLLGKKLSRDILTFHLFQVPAGKCCLLPSSLKLQILLI